jgi:hypothetical protein
MLGLVSSESQNINHKLAQELNSRINEFIRALDTNLELLTTKMQDLGVNIHQNSPELN